MPDETAPSVEVPSGETAPRAPLAQTPIDALQAQKAQESAQAVKEQALRQLLRVLDPQPSDYKLPYRQVLVRLEEVIAKELQSQGG